MTLSVNLRWKKACEEMDWALNQAHTRNHDRNPNRAAQVGAALEYGIAIGIAARGDEPLPTRPNLDCKI